MANKYFNFIDRTIATVLYLYFWLTHQIEYWTPRLWYSFLNPTDMLDENSSVEQMKIRQALARSKRDPHCKCFWCFMHLN